MALNVCSLKKIGRKKTHPKDEQIVGGLGLFFTLWPGQVSISQICALLNWSQGWYSSGSGFIVTSKASYIFNITVWIWGFFWGLHFIKIQILCIKKPIQLPSKDIFTHWVKQEEENNFPLYWQLKCLFNSVCAFTFPMKSLFHFILKGWDFQYW